MQESWAIEKSAELYGIKNWSMGYFDISERGEVVVTPSGRGGDVTVSLRNIITGLKERGLEMPVLLRLGDILDARIKCLHDSFNKAIEDAEYQGAYRGVYPIKVNQQQQVVEEITRFGEHYHHGLEAGSKAELIAALSFMRDSEAYLVCNGYKDEEFIDLGLYGRKMGIQCVFVVETPGELDLILERSAVLGVRPIIGVRMKLSTQGEGRWADSGGDHSVFGLNAAQVIDLVDRLREADMLDCLKLLHYHLGSQIPNIRDIREAVAEASRIYAGLVKEGAPMGLLDLGGGLAVDYDGSHTNFTSSSNYSLEEYCADIVEVVMSMLDEQGVSHPHLITESGRSTVAYYSVLLFNILDVSRFETHTIPSALPPGSHEYVQNLKYAAETLTTKNIQECYNDSRYYRDEIRQLFKHGKINLRDRALAEQLFWAIMARIARMTETMEYVPDDFEGLDTAMADIYYGNFSVFQSLPDAWAINQLFPIMPIHRLAEEPHRQAILADITCDCDGKIDRFIDREDVKRTLPVHELNADEEYYMGVFLVGAYQETLGDLHNLLGDTNVVSVRFGEHGEVKYTHEIEGDSVADVLSYVEYDTKTMLVRMRNLAEQAVEDKRISGQERRNIMEAYEAGLRGYTYFER